ncbi:protein phosphatase 1 regulatory subunit 1B-like [Pungitius pungitius]|uniref:protein phosphatase 1 regulatory subunit 1B-like n=1 Tax=Pungitius pungitius TaxID=134920 RepID=UPI001886FB15|nr:protein phosphatase 1 regulatory subunit 1B-like [Pungitius pungitius]
MEPLLPADTDVMEPEADKDARRKIQFSVPSSGPPQLDPRQVEMIRRRRPTPATLFRLTDPPSPEEDIGPHQWVLGENGALKAKLVHASTYEPPSLKAVQRMALAHLASMDMSSVDKDEPSSGEEDEEREKESEPTASASDLEHKPLREPSAPPDSLTSGPRRDEDEAKEREEEKGE